MLKRVLKWLQWRYGKFRYDRQYRRVIRQIRNRRPMLEYTYNRAEQTRTLHFTCGYVLIWGDDIYIMDNWHIADPSKQKLINGKHFH